MNDWQSIIGHIETINYLQHVLENNTIPQCMVFAGPAHVGKRTVADVFTSAIKERFPLSEVHHINAWNQEENAYKSISVDDIRSMISGSLYTQQSDSWNITIIDGADYLSEQASNALLKVTEEPGSKVIFILIAHRIERILPTIRSRACTLRFRLVPEAVLEAGLKKIGMIVNDDILPLTSGLPGLALQGKQSRFNADLFFAPLHEQLAVVSTLTSQDFTSVELALEKMAYTFDMPTQAMFLKSSTRYVAVHSMNRIGTTTNAYEHLFF